MSCVKKAYGTKVVAEYEIERMRVAHKERYKRDPAEVQRTAEFCQLCGMWHINYTERYGHANTRIKATV